MFTGIIQKVVPVAQVEKKGDALTFALTLPSKEDPLFLGESVAIDGVCLTVERIKGPSVFFTAVEESLSRTTIRSLSPGQHVNTERALKVGDRLGGHFVSGHVDGVGRVSKVISRKGAFQFWVEVPKELTGSMVSKGSVAINGVSLTLVEVKETSFSVALIPYTLDETNLKSGKVGDEVNIEVDMLAKLVKRLLRGERGSVDWSDLEQAGFL